MIAILLADGFNEVEVLRFIEQLHKNDIEIKTVSLNEKICTGACGIPIVCNHIADEINADDIHMAVLPLENVSEMNEYISPVATKMLNILMKKDGKLSTLCTMTYALENISELKSALEKEKKIESSTATSDNEYFTFIDASKEDDFLSNELEKSTEERPSFKNRVYTPRFTILKTNTDYALPSPELLIKADDTVDPSSVEELSFNADVINDMLASFGINATVSSADRGPRVTRYGVTPAKGVKVSRIINICDDLVQKLSVNSIRMEAPIPGACEVGIEIPVKNPTIVRLRSIIESDEFRNSSSKTSVCIGTDVIGTPLVSDLARMPHLIVSGSVGMGKSVFLHSVITSILYKAKPNEVKFILIDNDHMEFANYNDLPHLVMPIITEPGRAIAALHWAVNEMERRYELLREVQVRNVDAYNERIKEGANNKEFLHKIVIIIDELIPLMNLDKNTTELLIMRLGQKARASGIHLIVSTHSPSYNIISGLIKANIPSRITCRLASASDSKNLLDAHGAEMLLYNGDMLYAPAGNVKNHRVQGALVTNKEINEVVKYIKSSAGEATYDPSILSAVDAAAQNYPSTNNNENDDFEEPAPRGYLNDEQFLSAVELAVENRKISTSLLQRKLSIGYGKAAKFIDVMEDIGLVSEADGARPRVVLITADEWREKLARISGEE